MALSIEQTIKSLDNLIFLVENELPNRLVGVAIGTKTEIQNRIQETGLDADGRPLEEYAESTKRQKIKKGQPTSITTLTDTGKMWSQTRLTGRKKGKDFFVKIGGDTQDARDKLEYNSERYGDVLRASESEQKEVIEVTDDILQELVDRAFSGG